MCCPTLLSLCEIIIVYLFCSTNLSLYVLPYSVVSVCDHCLPVLLHSFVSLCVALLCCLCVDHCLPVLLYSFVSLCVAQLCCLCVRSLLFTCVALLICLFMCCLTLLSLCEIIVYLCCSTHLSLYVLPYAVVSV